MLQNAYLLAKIGAVTAENELNFAKILPVAERGRGGGGGWRRRLVVVVRVAESDVEGVEDGSRGGLGLLSRCRLFRRLLLFSIYFQILASIQKRKGLSKFAKN